MKCLVIGMGIGQLYKSVLKDLGYQVVTVDADHNKNADFVDVETAVVQHGSFDTVHICTPNFTHEPIARQVARHASIVFIEKPGLKTAAAWHALIKDFPSTRFMMVKNNQWRDNIDALVALANKSKKIAINWINNDRVPSPGSWFTTKTLSFGGVSRDLMPHLLSLFMRLDPNYKLAKQTHGEMSKNWDLTDLTGTDYGSINAAGTYDVDDCCELKFFNDGRTWNLTTDWRQNCGIDKRNIEFTLHDNSTVTVELGLCPEDAYAKMIEAAVSNVNNNEFWLAQNEQDLWIHNRIESLESTFA